MSKKNETQFVTFLNSAGEEISNDPLWLASKQLADAGVEGYKAPEFDVPGPYDELDGKALKDLAKERGIAIAGIRKASVFRDLLEQWDDEHGNEDDDNESGEGNESTDPQSGDQDDE